MIHSTHYFRLFFCGDVMLGRGIDQILPHPNKPNLYESCVTDARDYVLLAEKTNGKISYPVTWDYIWGDALKFWQDMQPRVKIINLETTLTQSEDYWPDKGINYRIHPFNVNVLKTAQVDICTLANNHILDWGYEIPESFRHFAHALIDYANVDVIFGHSSHHPRPIEIYHNKPILYGCGDFINDYEGISGYEEFRGDLTLMYFLDFDSESLEFKKMTLIPLQIRVPGRFM